MAKVKITIEDAEEEGHVNWTFKFRPNVRVDVDPDTLTTAQRVGWEMAQTLQEKLRRDMEEEEYGSGVDLDL